jgi:diguanylate cyclase (GGDEF)-like protein
LSEITRQVLDALPDAVVLHDEAGVVVARNSVAARWLDAFDDVLVDADGRPVAAEEHPVARALAGLPVRRSLYGRRGQGVTRWMIAEVNRVSFAWGTRRVALVASWRDVSRSQALEFALHEATEALDMTRDAVLVIDGETGRVLQANRACAGLLGEPSGALVGRRVQALQAGAPEPDHTVDTARALTETGHWEGQSFVRDRTGRVVGTLTRVRRLRGADGRPRDVAVLTPAGVVIDLWTAFHDPLTGLPDRAIIRDRLERAVHIAARNEQQVAVLLVDIDGFRALNAGYGHATGDRVLRGLAERLAAVRISDTVSRWSGDTFLILLDPVRDVEAAIEVAGGLCVATRGAFDLESDLSLTLTASVGVAVYPHDGPNVDMLLDSAERAVRAARLTGGDGVAVAP